MNSTELLQLAMSLTEEETERMANAMGWPTPSSLRNNLSRLEASLRSDQWVKPWRNFYPAHHRLAEVDWGRVVAEGLVIQEESPNLVTFKLTPLGQAVVRLRLSAEAIHLSTLLKEAI